MIAAAVALSLAYLGLSPRIGVRLYEPLLFHPAAYPSDFDLANLTQIVGHSPQSVYFASEGKLAQSATLHGWHFKSGDINAPTVLLSHGNAGNITGRTVLLSWLCSLGVNVFIYDYRGFGQSSARPSVPGVTQDGLSAYDYLVSQNIDPSKIVLYGESLGVAISTYIASQRAVSAMILQSGFASLRSIACQLYPILSIYNQTLFCQPALDSASILSLDHPPLLIFHGAKDQVVPVSHAHNLYQCAKGSKQLIVFDDCQHSDLVANQSERMSAAVKPLLKSICDNQHHVIGNA
ncbi:MAG: alpha/beta hydrolase [Candidatus Obscuribacter sp.]|nr:alpha/beta hydrolase [Candidatus Obscuribacter sp.]MBK9206172.1 alpha/beta hydrolase [Candidatus Obscuribacter sp.]MBK9770313.1 alpha/beta hydrolase [Candidatus Obscuribacter sp.]